MSHHESDTSWAAEQEAAQQQGPSPSGQVGVGVADPAEGESQPEVLARLPDLDAAEPGRDPEAKPAGSDGRILSQGFSTKLLIGGGVLLVAAAIFPFVFNTDSEPKPGTSPAPDAAPAPVWTPDAAQTAQSVPTISYEPNMSLNPRVPPAPEFLRAAQSPDAGPGPPTPASDRQGRVHAAEEPKRRQAGDSQAEQLGLNQPMELPEAAEPSSAQNSQPQAPPADRQPQADTDAAEARSNQTMRIHDPTGSAGDRTGEGRPGSQAATQIGPIARRPAWSMPAHRSVEPGVARLEGTIEKAPLRTSDDPIRSSLH